VNLACPLIRNAGQSDLSSIGAMMPTRVVLPLRICLCLGFPIALTLPASLSAQSVDGRPTVNVILDDRSAAGASELGLAKTRAGYLFDDAGIRIAWAIQGQAQHIANAGRDSVRVVVVDGSEDDHVTTDPILGFAVPLAHRVYVYYDRVQRLALGRKIQPGWFLGDVIAHEIAHVLLPDIRHTSTGVMAATLHPDPQKAPGFTQQEARALRAHLGETALARLRSESPVD